MNKLNSSSLRQNNLTKYDCTNKDCLFIYIKFKAMDHAHQHVPYFGRRKEHGSFVHVAYCITDSFRLLP